MGINTTFQTQNSLASQLASANSKTAGADKLAEQKNIPATDRDGDKDNSVASDSVNFSARSLNLSSTSSVQGTNNQTQIPDRQKAQEVVNQLVTGFQNNPNQAIRANANASAAGAARSLA